MELLVIVISLSLTGAQEIRLKGPENTLGAVGSTVTLRCSTPYRNCSGTDWIKHMTGSTPITIFKGPGTMLNTNVSDRARYSVDNSSGCDLIIRNVQLTDAGRFICSAIVSSSQTTKTAYLIILETQPKCTFNVSLNATVERDGVQLNCAVSHSATNGASMIWKEVTDAPDAVKNGNTTINRSYSVVASEPEVPSFTCEASFTYETIDNHYDIDKKPIVGLATNKIPNVNCSTSAIKVLYSVRNVALLPSLSSYSPGTIITCTAGGHPSPTFKWQEMETDGNWTDIQDQNGSVFNMTGFSLRRYRCIATNVVKGKNHNATSNEFLFNNTESDAPTNTSLLYTLMAVAVGILLLIILLIVCFCSESCPGYKYCNAGNKSKDNLRVEQPLTENPDVCIYSAVNKGQDIHPKAKSPKRPKGPPPQPKASYADVYQNEECTYADLAMEYGPRKVVPQNGQAAQEESVYAAVSMA